MFRGANWFWGETFWGAFCIVGYFVSEGFCPRWFFDGWFMARCLLSGDFLRGPFDRIPCLEHGSFARSTGFQLLPAKLQLNLFGVLYISLRVHFSLFILFYGQFSAKFWVEHLVLSYFHD